MCSPRTTREEGGKEGQVHGRTSSASIVEVRPPSGRLLGKGVWKAGIQREEKWATTRRRMPRVAKAKEGEEDGKRGCESDGKNNDWSVEEEEDESMLQLINPSVLQAYLAI